MERINTQKPEPDLTEGTSEVVGETENNTADYDSGEDIVLILGPEGAEIILDLQLLSEGRIRIKAPDQPQDDTLEEQVKYAGPRLAIDELMAIFSEMYGEMSVQKVVLRSVI